MKIGIAFELAANKLPADIDAHLEGSIAAASGVPKDAVLSYSIQKRSIDARKKPNVKLLYTATAEIRTGVIPKKAVLPPREDPEIWHVPENAAHLKNPVIAGAGPAGLFAALVLAEAGANPVVIERGCDVVRRKQDIDTFFRERKLRPESNLLYGEGGAGTWSDGKLFTRVRDIRAPYVLEKMIEAGAPEQIRYFAHPHIGSDRLPETIAKIREKIISLGGTFRWNSCVKGIRTKDGKFVSLELAEGETFDAPVCVLAPGHSARELLLALTKSGVEFELKQFQIGCRIEHPQEFINFTQFGVREGIPACGPAEYLCASRGFPEKNIAGATTFCMCPGGEILPVTAIEGTLSTNGMSNAARSGAFANSAVITGIPENTFTSPEEAFSFLTSMEKRLFEAGGRDYSCPAQRAKYFIYGEKAPLPSGHSYRLGLTSERVDKLLPGQIYDAVACALRHFDRMFPGFIREGVVTGTETHVSSPLRFKRNLETLESSIKNLYIAGEGGGMAGGIVSAALDGVKIAEKILSSRQ